MIRLLIALILSGITLAQSTPDKDAPPPPSEQSKSQEPGLNLPAERSPPVFKPCGPKNKPHCPTAPQPIASPQPDYSKEARKKKIQGQVVLWLIVGPNGVPRDFRVVRSLGYGLDEEAVKAVQKWRFIPSKLDGRPVAVQINVEVTFRLW
jgi:TonB family protein